jgi:hypothetical protein
MKERIICAAIHYPDWLNRNLWPVRPLNITKGTVITGLRHADCTKIAKSIKPYNHLNQIQSHASSSSLVHG